MTSIYDVDADIISKVLNTLELIMRNLKMRGGKNGCKTRHLKDFYSTVNTHQFTSGVKMGKYCYDLVIKCIASHRYEEAIKLYWILCHDKTIIDHARFKVGIILLMNMEIKDKNDCLLSFFRSMLNALHLNMNEVLLEFIMCAFKCEIPEIQTQVKEFKNRKILSTYKKHDKDSILDAYIVLLEWCNSFSGDMNRSQSQTNKEVTKLKKYTEDSDMFILQLIKLMELCDRQYEIENELQNYVESNPDNINALIYICTYLYHRHPNSDKLINYLEILAEKCISDVRTLWLIEIWQEKGVSSLKILNYCFMFLDYPTNGENIKAWKALWKNLTEAQQDCSVDDSEIYSLWKSRRRSWMWMYFNPQKLPVTQSKDKLIAYKVAFLLMFSDGKKYVKKVFKYHPATFELGKSLKNFTCVDDLQFIK